MKMQKQVKVENFPMKTGFCQASILSALEYDLKDGLETKLNTTLQIQIKEKFSRSRVDLISV